MEIFSKKSNSMHTRNTHTKNMLLPHLSCIVHSGQIVFDKSTLIYFKEKSESENFTVYVNRMHTAQDYHCNSLMYSLSSKMLYICSVALFPTTFYEALGIFYIHRSKPAGILKHVLHTNK